MSVAERWGLDAAAWQEDPEDAAAFDASTWFRKPGDVDAIIAAFEARIADPPPVYGVRDDGQALFYRGEVNSIFGSHSTAKSWTMLLVAKQAIEAGQRVLYLDFEDHAAKAVRRLLSIGADPDALRDRFLHIRPEGRYSEGERAMLAYLVQQQGVDLVIIDTVGVALGAEGLDANKDTDVAGWLAEVPNRLAKLGPAVVLVDHIAESVGNENKPGGSGRKMQSISCAAYYAKRLKPFGKGRTGSSVLICKKDRNGTHAIGDKVAVFTLASEDEWSATATLTVPDVSTAVDEGKADADTAQDRTAALAAQLEELSAPLDISGRKAAELLNVRQDTALKAVRHRQAQAASRVFKQVHPEVHP